MSRVEMSPVSFLAGCALLAVALLLTRRVAYQVAHRTSNVVDIWDIVREVSLIGLVCTMLAAVALIAAGLFEYR
ncbi:MAG: hypothetical protein WED83_03710 [Acidimicrobiia bacterium]